MRITDKIIFRLLRQCRKPDGWFGALLAKGMNSSHSRFTDWGLGHVSMDRDFIILDVGCGGGRTVGKMSMSAPDGKVFGLDYSDKSVAMSIRTNRRLIREGRVEILSGTVSNLPFPDGMFGLVTAVETHYFWPDLVSDMKEVLRVLKPAGTFAVMGEAYKGGKYEKRNRKLIEMGDMAYHSPDELCDILLKAGFSDVQSYEEYDKGWLCCIGKNFPHSNPR